jgi:hypothetical protein
MACPSVFLWNPAAPCCRVCDYCFEPSGKPEDDVWRVTIDGVQGVINPDWKPAAFLRWFAGSDEPYTLPSCEDGENPECVPCESTNGTHELVWTGTVNQNTKCPIYVYSKTLTQKHPDGNAKRIFDEIGVFLEERGWEFRGSDPFPRIVPSGIGHWRHNWDTFPRLVFMHGSGITLESNIFTFRTSLQLRIGPESCSFTITFRENQPSLRETTNVVNNLGTFFYTLEGQTLYSLGWLHEWDFEDERWIPPEQELPPSEIRYADCEAGQNVTISRPELVEE